MSSPDTTNTPEYQMRSRRDAARILGVSIQTVDRMVADGQLSVVRVRRRVLIPDEAIDRLIHHELDQAA